MVELILQKWTFMRFLRLGIGVWLIVESITSHETMFMLLGGLFTAQAIFNMGCVGGNCAVPARRRPFSKTEETTFEEIK
jgi:hypothetical protein